MIARRYRTLNLHHPLRNDLDSSCSSVNKAPALSRIPKALESVIDPQVSRRRLSGSSRCPPVKKTNQSDSSPHPSPRSNLSFSKTKAISPVQGRFGVSTQNSSQKQNISTSSKTEFLNLSHWMWREVGGEWKPYSTLISDRIELKWCDFGKRTLEPNFTTTLTRLNDNQEQNYSINILTMKQKNLKTLFTRSIKRDKIDVEVRGKGKWQFSTSLGWDTFDDSCQDHLEQSFINYCTSSGPSICWLTISKSTYKIDLARGIRCNVDTLSVRRLRRLYNDLSTTKVAGKSVNSVVLPSNSSLSLLAVSEARFPSSSKSKTTSTNLGGHNTRLNQLLSPTTPLFTSKSRDQVQAVLCHILLWKCRCTIYGGYVRDFVIRGTPANDIDVVAPSSELGPVIKKFISETGKSGLFISKERITVIAYVVQKLTITVSDFDFEVDFTAPGASRKAQGAAPPYVEADVSNLQLSVDKKLHLKEPLADPHVDFNVIIDHCLRKQFVFYYDLTKYPNLCYRLKRRVQRGWTCLTAIPKRHHHVFHKQNHLYRPVKAR
ncbi:hypothetical protein GEMRC1_003475 [Eukaryota sp. GEM-RC1]